jgi:polyisoprenoid-binding protein YceI
MQTFTVPFVVDGEARGFRRMSETITAKTAASIYQINSRASRFTVQAFAEGLLSAFGHNPKLNATTFTGEVVFPPDEMEAASLRFKVGTESLHVVDNVSEKDRREIERMMHEEVLEADRFPDIVFVSRTVSPTRIYEGFYRMSIAGQLALHGVVRDHAIEAQVRLTEDGLRAEGESRLLQSSFGIKRVSVAGGTLKVKDEVKLSFDIVADLSAPRP